jgi:hypothetical protein
MTKRYDLHGGVAMRTNDKAKNRSIRPVPASVLEQDIASIEAMSDEEIDRELESYGIDPQRAIAKVTATVRNKMSEFAKRGALHAEKTVGHRTPAAHAIPSEE